MLEHELTGKQELALIEEIVHTESNDPNENYDRLPLISYVDEKPVDEPGSDPQRTKKYRLLKELDEAKIIVLIDPPENDSYEIGIIDSSKLGERYRKAYIRSLHDDGEPANIIYWPAAGICKVNGYRVRLKGKNKRIFTALFNHANKPIDRGFVWRAAGRRGKPRDDADTITLNADVTNLRRALGGISPKQLRLRGTVELWAYTYLTDENDLITEKISTI